MKQNHIDQNQAQAKNALQHPGTPAASDASRLRREASTPQADADKGGTGSGSVPGVSGSGVPPENKPNAGEGEGPAR